MVIALAVGIAVVVTVVVDVVVVDMSEAAGIVGAATGIVATLKSR
jgi:hypothetical protein